MQKSRLATIFIIIIILIYGLLSSFYFIHISNTIYWNMVNPLFWIILSVILNFVLGKNFDNRKLKRNIIQYTTVAILVYIITYMVSRTICNIWKKSIQYISNWLDKKYVDVWHRNMCKGVYKIQIN